MSDEVDSVRRRLVTGLVVGAAAAPFMSLGGAEAGSGSAATSLGELRHVDAGVLNVEYAERAPPTAAW